jgi:hypothetical protein
MKTFFIIYWAIIIAAALAYRSYDRYYRHHVKRHEYAERHRRKLSQLSGRSQLQMFQ